MILDLASTDHLLSTTRAVRRKLDLDRPVPDDVLLDCLRLAVQAPTPGRAEGWRWLIVRDQARKDGIGALFREVGQEYMRAKVAGLGSAAHEPATARAIASARYLVDVIERVPVFVIPCVLGRPRGGNEALSVFYGGIFPAVWNFQLALRSRGLGSTLTSYHLEREAEAAEILGIPPDVTQVGLLPIGYTTAADFRPGPRTPVAEISYRDGWGVPLVGSSPTT
jgi:nitroreductase